MAAMVSTRSKDPSTKVGAVIARPDRSIASVGYNGFPKGILDDERLHDRDTKYSMILHAEENAVLNAREDLSGYTLYVHPIFPCAHCFRTLRQKGISRLVGPYPSGPRWVSPIEKTVQLCRESNTQFSFLRLPSTFTELLDTGMQRLLLSQPLVIREGENSERRD